MLHQSIISPLLAIAIVVAAVAVVWFCMTDAVPLASLASRVLRANFQNAFTEVSLLQADS